MPARSAVWWQTVRTVDEGPAGEAQARGGGSRKAQRQAVMKLSLSLRGHWPGEGLTSPVEVLD